MSKISYKVLIYGGSKNTSGIPNGASNSPCGGEPMVFFIFLMDEKPIGRYTNWRLQKPSWVDSIEYRLPTEEEKKLPEAEVEEVIFDPDSRSYQNVYLGEKIVAEMSQVGNDLRYFGFFPVGKWSKKVIDLLPKIL